MQKAQGKGVCLCHSCKMHAYELFLKTGRQLTEGKVENPAKIENAQMPGSAADSFFKIN